MKLPQLALILLVFAESSVVAQRKIFDGKTLDGWEGDAAIWRVEDGAITASIEDGERLEENEFIYWDGEVADFDLSLEYRIVGPAANSGIQFRSRRDASGQAIGYQADLDDGRTWLGRVYDEHGRALIAERGALTKIGRDGTRHVFAFSDPAVLAKNAKPDVWNHYRILSKGQRTEIYVNGVHFSTLEDYQTGQSDLAGVLGLQMHSGSGPAKIQFRDIRLSPLGSSSALAAADLRVDGKVPADAANIGFENGTYDGWRATGEVWGDGPIEGDTIVLRGRGNSIHDGQYWVGGYEREGSDAGQGTLTSEAFAVASPWAGYRLGAGPTAQTRIEIVDAASGDVLHRASGRGQVEDMALQAVDLRAHLGKRIRVCLVDESSAPWGHLNYDDFRFYEKAPVAADQRVATSPLLWHLRENPRDESVGADTTNRMMVPEGFRVETIASEPLLRQPIAFTFDSRGRIWIAEAFAYPRRRAEGEAGDRIVILEDGDGDGRFETHRVFADGLNLVSGFEIGYGGVFVGAAPELLFIPDADGDDVPDGPAKVMLDGWDLNDTHETLNSFMWGHDGWLYGCHGVFNDSWVGKPGQSREERLLVKAGVWRFHPVTHHFEIYAHGGSNQWGLDYNAEGAMFMTHCRSSWGLGPVSQVIRDGHYWTQDNRNHRPFIATDVPGWNRRSIALSNLLSSAAAYGHGEGGAGGPGARAVFGGHSHVGAMVYLGDNWPEEYRGDLFTHNLHGHQLNRELLKPFDSGFLSSSHGQDALYVGDRRYLGVDLKYGPDGAVYFNDWSDTQQCHVVTPESWDRTNGRLYRMAWSETFEPLKVEDLSRADESELLDFLQHENEWYARMAQHVLRQRAAVGEVSAEVAVSLRSSIFGGQEERRLRFLVALYAVGGIDSATYGRLLQSDDETVRAQAIHFLTEGEQRASSLFANRLIAMARTDPSARVRLVLAGAAQKRLADEVSLPVIRALSMRGEDGDDRFVPKMLWYAYQRFAKAAPAEAAELAMRTPLPVLRDSILWQLAAGDLDTAIATASTLENPGDLSRATAIILQALREVEGRPAPGGWGEYVAKAGAAGDEATAKHLALLNAKFGIGDVVIDRTGERMELAKTAFAICAACHQPGLDLPGPSLEDIARVYETKPDIVAWLKAPVKKRENYPQMPAFDKLDQTSLELAAEYLLEYRKSLPVPVR